EARAVAPFFRDRQQQLGLRHRLDVAAVGPAEVVFRAEPRLAEAADRVRAAGEILTIRRQRRGVAERAAIGQLGVEHDRELAPDRQELQIVVRGAPVLDLAAGERVADVEAVPRAAVGKDSAVARVEAPAEVELVSIELAADDFELERVGARAVADDLAASDFRIAVVAYPVDRLHGAAALGGHELGALRRDADADVLELGDRPVVVEAEGHRLGVEVRSRRGELRDVAIAERDRPLHFVDRRVAIGVREVERLRIAAGVDFGGDAVAGAHEIRVHEVALQDHRLRLGVTDAAAELTRQAFLDVEVDVDQVGRAGHLVGLDFDLLDERQALNTLLGALHRSVRQVRAFELAHLAPEYFVVHAR